MEIEVEYKDYYKILGVDKKADEASLIFFVGPLPDVQVVFHLFQERHGFDRQHGLNFLEKRVQVVINKGTFQDLEHIPSEVKGHHFSQLQWERQAHPFGGQNSPAILFSTGTGIIKRETRFLQCVQVAIKRPPAAVHLLRDFVDGGAHG